jgi:hypothetical protein
MTLQIFKYLFATCPTLITFFFSIKLFPYTGLGRIVALPTIFMVNSLIIIAALKWTRNLKFSTSSLVWLAVSILTIIIAIAFYPQEGSPHVVKQVGYSISAIKNYDSIQLSDLEILISPKDNQKGIDEKYVVALYKYRNQIPLDGSFHIYRENKRNITSYKDTSIKAINEIPKKLEGHHKLIWWYLERTRK